MVASADLYIPIDAETKADAEQLFASFGITVSEAVNIFLHQSLLAGGLPFNVRMPRYNEETEAAIQEARDIATGKIQTKTYGIVAEMNADIDAEPDDLILTAARTGSHSDLF